MPHRPKPEGPFKLSLINKKLRQGTSLTPEEREYRNAYYRAYEPGRINIRTRPSYVEEWTKLAEGRGMSRSEWCEERILVSLRPEGPEVKELREQLAKRDADIDLQRKQFSDLALERAADKEAMRELERDLRARVAEELRLREELRRRGA